MEDSLKHYETVIWDWNGTLLDDVELCVGVMNELLEEHGGDAVTRGYYRTIFGFPVRDYYERAGFDLDKHVFAYLSEEFCSRFEERLSQARLFPETNSLLESLGEQGKRQFVLSNTEESALQRMLTRYDLRRHFEGVQGIRNNMATGKVDAGKELVQRESISPDRTVMVGDTLHDADVASELGFDCILVSSGHHSHERLSARGVRVVDSLGELLQSVAS